MRNKWGISYEDVTKFSKYDDDESFYLHFIMQLLTLANSNIRTNSPHFFYYEWYFILKQVEKNKPMCASFSIILHFLCQYKLSYEMNFYSSFFQTSLIPSLFPLMRFNPP